LKRNPVYLALFVSAIWSGCSSPSEVGTGTGGSLGTGGVQPTTGGVQQQSSGGASLGGMSAATGGTSGGASNTGGISATGGSGPVGGASGGVGGALLTGGAFATGGSAGNAGTATSGGNSNSGGSGGKASTGGQNNGGTSKGGGSSTGGNSTGGNSTGGNSTGGVTSTPCSLTGSPNPGSASFTWYHFSQGTYKDTNSGKYQTACGYLGTANGMTDTVENSSTPTYFVAIPGQNSMNFENSKYCGACVQLTNGGTNVVATVIDECPRDSNPLCVNGHLDVSKSAFDRLGYNVGNPKNTTWKFVPCPVMGTVKVRMKNGNPNEIYIENSILALQSVTMDGVQARRQHYGAWHFDGNISPGATLTLTDLAGRTITVTVPLTTQGLNQDTGKQFPTCQ
jgi:expansin (peptidoglycan-binding protein)